MLYPLYGTTALYGPGYPAWLAIVVKTFESRTTSLIHCCRLYAAKLSLGKIKITTQVCIKNRFLKFKRRNHLNKIHGHQELVLRTVSPRLTGFVVAQHPDLGWASSTLIPRRLLLKARNTQGSLLISVMM